jgi:catechol 2,3-dioxygenase-like lactoylglutathione lyase family enzyme
MKIRHIDHIGIVVNDLEAAKAFFVDFGFTVMGEMLMEGELVERVIGLKDVRDNLVMLQAPDGQLNLELVKFQHPVDPEGIHPLPANAFGLRHIALEVEDLDNIIGTLQKKGIELVGEVQTYENSWKLCYVRGPEGIILELAEQLK